VTQDDYRAPRPKNEVVDLRGRRLWALALVGPVLVASFVKLYVTCSDGPCPVGD
jgi:hypothetical protein